MKLKIISNDLLLKVIVGGNNCSCITRNGTVLDGYELDNIDLCEIRCCISAACFNAFCYAQEYSWNGKVHKCFEKENVPQMYKRFLPLRTYFKNLGLPEYK